jgi:uncharacterized protein YndB with AHSA1/START domain
MDVRIGGRWRVVMLQPDGTRHIAFGTYREVTPPHRLVFTHAWVQGDGSSPETTVTVEFHEEFARARSRTPRRRACGGRTQPAARARAGGTRVVLTQVGFSDTGTRDGHKEGRASSMDRLVDMFAAG